MTDAVGAAIHLGAESLSYEPQGFGPGIDAMFVERAAALDEYMRVQMRVPSAAPTRSISRAMQVLVDTAPGIREIISMGKPIFDTWQEGYDLVIVDAPPLGQLMSYLRAPSVVARLVPTGAVRDQAARMAATLVDAETAGLLLVATPEELPASETREALAELESEPIISLEAVIANRVLPKLDLTPEYVAQLPDRPATAAAVHHLGLLAAQHNALDSLPIDIQLPYLFGVHTPPEVAAQLADAWEDAS